ncbi:Uroporphyrinogen-III synthase [Neolecta irregularis DAH-3]|uniref:Uroporphyrinogen-III synthase n=1 Tax=Neolecta irregularis (strain DAH-3) TaxID=1198029 RepID=A0A1U7LP61_NEOID|nr:Uroporphyrinogen-III synthase [Neolecta irregularis DAH-3]|eukprot:OLL24311.1 Uroporphyrinogen-III synthase [Neolecta irregularis DAH-3]
MAVLLLKSPTVPDPYTRCFQQCGRQILHLPVLTHSHVNPHLLLQSLASLNYSALVITSPRAAAALSAVLDSLAPGQTQNLQSRTVYTVGPATGAALAALGFTDIQGSHAGTGELLADYIIHHHSSDNPLLFLTGDHRRDAIPTKLRLANRPFTELVVYKTVPAPDFHSRFTQTLAEHAVDWIVFFSPAGAEAALATYSSLTFKIAAIGPTTQEYLQQHNITPDVVALKPDPQHLLDGILTFEEKQ